MISLRDAHPKAQDLEARTLVRVSGSTTAGLPLHVKCLPRQLSGLPASQ